MASSLEEVIVVVGARIPDPVPFRIKGVYEPLNNVKVFCPFTNPCNSIDFVDKTCYIETYTLCCIVITKHKQNKSKTAKKVQITFISTPSQSIHGRTSPIVSVNIYYLKPGEKFVRYTHVPREKKLIIKNNPFVDMEFTGSSFRGQTANIVFSVDNRLQLHPEECRHCGCSLNNKRQYFYLNMDLFEESDFKKKFDQLETILERQIEYERENKQKNERENKQKNERDKKEYGLKVILKRAEEPWMMIDTQESS